MKISGKFILKVAGTLTVISLVVALLLGLVNGVTKDKIAAIEAEKTRVAMSAVVPEGSEFTDKLEIPQAAMTPPRHRAAPSASCTASPTAALRPVMWPRLPLPAPRAPSP